MTRNGKEITVGKHRLQKAGFDQVGRRLLQKAWPAQIPVCGPLLEQFLPIFRCDQRGLFREMSFSRKAEAAGSPESESGRKDGLQMLSLVLRDSGIRKSTDLGVLTQETE